LTRRNNIESIDITPYLGLADTVDRIYISGKNLCIELKNPKKDTIIVTIRNDFTPFRKEIERLLKEKGVKKEDSRDILNIVDNNYTIIYKDNAISMPNEFNDSNNKDASDQSDQSDQSDNKEVMTVNISRCIKLDSGRVKVTGNIVGISEPYKVVSAIEQSCGCRGGEDNWKTFDPPFLHYLKTVLHVTSVTRILNIKKLFIKMQ